VTSVDPARPDGAQLVKQALVLKDALVATLEHRLSVSRFDARRATSAARRWRRATPKVPVALSVRPVCV